MKALKKVKTSKEDVEKKAQCSVCMVDYEEGEETTQLPCQHLFHDGCITPWLDIVSSSSLKLPSPPPLAHDPSLFRLLLLPRFP